MAKTPHSQCKGPRFNPWSGNLIPHTVAERSHMLQLRPSTTRLIHIYIYDHCKGDYKITLVPIKSGRNLNLTMLSDGKIWCGPGIPRIEYSGPRKTG